MSLYLNKNYTLDRPKINKQSETLNLASLRAVRGKSVPAVLFLLHHFHKKYYCIAITYFSLEMGEAKIFDKTCMKE